MNLQVGPTFTGALSLISLPVPILFGDFSKGFKDCPFVQGSQLRFGRTSSHGSLFVQLLKDIALK